MKQKIKQNKKVIVSFILGVLVSTTTVYATTILASKDVYYDNSKSGGSYATVQGAIEELYDKAASCNDTSDPSSNFIEAYTYDQDNDNTKCITGEEDTCVKTDCYKTKTSGSCPAGTIIKYKVNSSDTVTFHVMFDEGETMTMQSQRSTIYNIRWNGVSKNTTGPTKIFGELDELVLGWNNVNIQKYELGKTSFSNKGYYTGCSGYNSCTANKYTLDSRISRARMITVQEAVALGCTDSKKSCPIWMINYLSTSTDYGGTVNDYQVTTDNVLLNDRYWTMNAMTSNTTSVWNIHVSGAFGGSSITSVNGISARAVVNVSK